ncbi:hypothetical protein ACOSQ2_014838 [Xanthoceras sorbifolium]
MVVAPLNHILKTHVILHVDVVLWVRCINEVRLPVTIMSINITMEKRQVKPHNQQGSVTLQKHWFGSANTQTNQTTLFQAIMFARLKPRDSYASLIPHLSVLISTKSPPFCRKRDTWSVCVTAKSNKREN